MSNTQGYSQRRSWRSERSSTVERRWFGRVFLSLSAAVLLLLFVYWLFPERRKSELHTFLIHAGSFDLRAIMPPMYGETAANQIKNKLNATKVDGASAKIGGFFRNDVGLGDRLKDPDDTLLIVVRGYVFKNESGKASIACSDLAADQKSDSKTIGLVEFDELLKRLTLESETPESFSGTRLIVLDIEPLAALPRLNQYDDDIFEALQDSLKKLTAPFADRIWVLVTRGRLQNIGWDPQDKLPIATQTLLDAIDGAADFNNDGNVHLDELCRYSAARYARLAQTAASCPKIVLLRGGTGVVENFADAELAWVNRVKPIVDESQSKPLSKPANEQPKLQDEKAAEALPTASNIHTDRLIKQVRFDAAKDDVPVAGKVGNNADVTIPTPAAAPGADVAIPADATAPVDQVGTAADAVVTAPDRFWDIRDWLESGEEQADLHPIAVAPHLWRTLVQDALHAELLQMDQDSVRSIASLAVATDDLLTLKKMILTTDALDYVGRPSVGGAADRLFQLWREATENRKSQLVDDQVRVADQLQLMIAVGRMRLWSRTQYEYQAIVNGGETLGDDLGFGQELDDAEKLLADQSGAQVDVSSMHNSADKIRASIRRSDSVVSQKITKLLEDFARAVKGTSWHNIRRAHAWLRSPLPSGKQRQALLNAINKSPIERPSKEVLMTDSASLRLGDGTPERDRGQQVNGAKLPVETMLKQTGGWAALKNELEDKSNFAKQFLASIQIDPRDIEMFAVTAPILHNVIAIPVQRQLSSTLRDSDRVPLTGSLAMKNFKDYVSVEIKPSATKKTSFRLTSNARKIGGQYDDRVLETNWKQSIDAEPAPDGQSVKLTIPAGKVGQVQLDMKVFRHGDSDLSEVPLEIDIQAIDIGNDQELVKLNEKKKLSIRLPQKDRIRVAVRTAGLSQEKISDDDSLPGGVWLRTFVARKTIFTPTLFNDSGRACRLRLWLIQLENPFLEEQVEAYWPEVLVSHMNQVRGNVVGSDGRVSDTVLSGKQLLKGPVDLELAGGAKRTPIAWGKPAGAVNPASSALPPTTAADPIDVSHGLALVARPIDEAGQVLPGQDQVIWLVAKPWFPEEYVELQAARFEQGNVKVSAKLKKDFDGDQIEDTIPEIKKAPVKVAWTPNDQWDGFSLSSAKLDSPQYQELKAGIPSRGQIEVPVAQSPDRKTMVQLDVDGWPRAILRSIEQREGAFAKEESRYDRIQFSSVQISYPAKEPPDVDNASLDTMIYYPDPQVPVVFRGRGKSLRTVLAADLTTDFYGKNIPPEVKLHDGSRFWTDRIVRTVADQFQDDGQISLTTKVEDIHADWNPEAARADGISVFKADLKVGDLTTVAEMQVTLDSTPPTVDELRPFKQGPYYVGTTIQWRILCSDPEKNSACSGIRKLVVGLDKNGDDKPDSADRKMLFKIAERSIDNKSLENKNLLSFKPDSAGTYRIAAQVWDDAGWESLPKSDSIDVREKPAPPTPAPPSVPTPPPTPVPTPPKPEVAKRGTLKGKIDSGSTLRGKLTLSPVPPEIRPADGVLEIGSAQPSFSFSNVPEGVYELKFEGTVNGSSKSFSWPGLDIKTMHALKPN